MDTRLEDEFFYALESNVWNYFSCPNCLFSL